MIAGLEKNRSPARQTCHWQRPVTPWGGVRGCLTEALKAVTGRALSHFSALPWVKSMPKGPKRRMGCGSLNFLSTFFHLHVFSTAHAIQKRLELEEAGPGRHCLVSTPLRAMSRWKKCLITDNTACLCSDSNAEKDKSYLLWLIIIASGSDSALTCSLLIY